VDRLIIPMTAMVAALALAFSVDSRAAELVLTWQAPTKRVDGTALLPADIEGYEIKQTKPPVTATKLVTGLTDTYTVTGPGVFCYQGRTVDKQKQKSAWSAEACATVNAAPEGITIITITIN
jgi:hypothetical protein